MIREPQIVIIGVGKDSRRDDSAGLRFVRILGERLGDIGDIADIDLIESDGDPGEILDSWTGARIAIVVDASSSGASPGTVIELDIWKGSNGFGLRHSTHGTGVMEAVHLGSALGRMPSSLRVFAVEGADFGFGEGLSQAVEKAIDRLVDRVASDLGGRTAERVKSENRTASN